MLQPLNIEEIQADVIETEDGDGYLEYQQDTEKSLKLLANKINELVEVVNNKDSSPAGKFFEGVNADIIKITKPD